MKRPGNPSSLPVLERRTLLEWMGQATVLGLASPLIQACGASAGPGADAGADDTGPGDAATRDLPIETSVDAAGRPDAEGPEVSTEIGPGDDAGEIGDVNPDPTRLEGASCPTGGPPTAASPASNPIFGAWKANSVDEQSLADLLANWRLRIDGLVASPRTFTFCDLLALGLVRQVTDFHCVEGWSVYDVPWDGVRLSALLDLAGPDPSATHLSFTCRGGTYTESLPLAVAREPKSLLGLGVDGHTLPMSHGFPARVVVPRLLGYKNAKHVETITLADHELVGFWPKFGYPVSGEVPPERLRPGKY
jgi:hypothetical protein